MKKSTVVTLLTLAFLVGCQRAPAKEALTPTVNPAPTSAPRPLEVNVKVTLKKGIAELKGVDCPDCQTTSGHYPVPRGELFINEENQLQYRMNEFRTYPVVELRIEKGGTLDDWHSDCSILGVVGTRWCRVRVTYTKLPGLDLSRVLWVDCEKLGVTS